MNLPVFLVLFSAGSLVAAFTSQYMFGLEPCILCLYQRLPFFAVLFLSLLSLITTRKTRLILVGMCGVLLLAGASIAVYHVGVERGTFEMADGCVDTGGTPSSIEEMTKQLMGAPSVPCNEVQFSFLGLSMAAWNMLFSSFFGVVTLMMAINGFKALRALERSEKYRAENKKGGDGVDD